MPGRMEFEFQIPKAKGPPELRRSQDEPMRILIMGDFRGHPADRRPALADRRMVGVDVDNFEDVMIRFAPRLDLSMRDGAAMEVAVEFSELDDFHPDQLVRKLEVFQALRQTRARLLDPATFAQTAATLRSELAMQPQVPEEPRSSGPSEQASLEDDESTFERLLGKEQGQARPRPQVGSQQVDITQFIGRIVGPYVVPEADPHQPVYVASVDEATGAQMRKVLHDPAFQALEAAWRAVHWLITELETGEDLKLYLLDVTKQELEVDLHSAGGNWQASALYRLLVEKGARTLGGQPWSLLVGNYTFAKGSVDIALLATLGAIASHSGGPFLAAADPNLLGCRSLGRTPDPKDWKRDDAESETQRRWQALRTSSVAPWIGLALPRVMLRLPYGKETDEVERFEFEEMWPERNHDAYLWGNPAFACALLLATGFQERGWSMQPGDHRDVDELPAHTYQDEGESKMQPCAEENLSERAAEAILSRGVMPLLSFRNRNAVRLVRFQSLADPPAALSGPWG